MTTKELYHYGIMGQKWGVRRYQYEDGSLTPEGKKRYGTDDSAGKQNSSVDRYQIGKGMASDTVNILNNAEVINNEVADIRKRNKKKKMDISNKSNAELHREVNRMKLEKEYKDLKSEDMVSGQRAVNNVLSIAGAGVSIAASAVAIAIGVKVLKNMA